jgi:two-component system, sporulation sensor kinase E
MEGIPVKSGFLDRLIERLDRLDPKSVQIQFLRLAQERGLLEMIFQSIQEGVIVVSGSGKVTYANRAAENLIGFSLEKARGRPIARYLREIDWDRVLGVDEGEWSKLLTQEIEITYPQHRFVSFYVVPLHAQEESERGAVVILRDVTGDRQQEASMMESERLNAVKLLAASVAHEIGNPLNALTIHLQLLDREIRQLAEGAPAREGGRRGRAAAGSPPGNMGTLQELVEVARNEVSRLDMIIAQFLRAVRPAKPNFEPAKIDGLLEETLALLKQEVQNRRIEIEIDCQSPVPKLPIDRSQMKQAFFNLIRNAFQAMPDGGSLKISVTCNDSHMLIAFRDTGVGIKPEDFGRIFEPYHTTKPEGSGLGLMIVQRIVQDHGGQIEVVSKPGQGTVFTILLPLAERRVRLLKAGEVKLGLTAGQAESAPPGSDDAF